jgi:hypothetical protein
MSQQTPPDEHENHTGLSRRDLFRTAGFAAGGAMLLGLPRFLGKWTDNAEAGIAASPSTSNLMLELDGQPAGFVRTVQGGNAFADIIAEAVGPDLIQRKRPGPVKFEDLVIEVPVDRDAKSLNGWITDTLAKGPTQHNGAIIFADFNFTEVKRLEFFNAVLTEVTLPAADAVDGKKAALLTLRITPQTTRLAGGAGKKLSTLGSKSKGVLASNFRFNVQGLEQACKRISKVDQITAKRSATGAPVGQDKFRQPPSGSPGVLDCSTVRITLPEADAGPFYQWFDDTVLKGRPDGERPALLEWLDPTLQTVLATVQLGSLGIVRYAPEKTEAGAEARGPRVQIDMYCETIDLKL